MREAISYRQWYLFPLLMVWIHSIHWIFADALHLLLVGKTASRRITHPSLAPISTPLNRPPSSLSATTLIRACANDEDPVQETELWLDLRGTNIMPKTALARLEFDLDQRDLVSRVLTSEGAVVPGQDCARDVLTIPQDQDDMKLFAGSASSRTAADDDVVGRRLHLRDPSEGGFTDPIPALDAVTEGRWCLLDSHRISDQESRSAAVASLVELLFGAAAAGKPDGGGSLLLLGGRSSSAAADRGKLGGIAWTGFDKRDIFHAATLLQTLCQQSNVVATESGILLSAAPSSSEDHGDAEDATAVRPQTALVLPFDEILWKAAAVVFRMSTTVDEGDMKR